MVNGRSGTSYPLMDHTLLSGREAGQGRSLAWNGVQSLLLKPLCSVVSPGRRNQVYCRLVDHNLPSPFS